jgi:uncharacterized membrane-anchored protein YitT (DUF2179 family)
MPLKLSKKHKKIWNFIKTYFVITLSLFIMALGWTAFIIPSEIVGGGITGVATLVYYTTGLPVGVTVLSVNAILILIAIRILGANFGAKTIFSIVTLSVFFALLQYYIREPWVADKFMAAIIGGVMGGIGVGMVFTQGSSTGGTDIIAMIVNKYRNISPGKVILLCDVIIIGSSYFLFHSIETVVYGFVVMSVAVYAIDLMLTGSKQSVQLFVFSNSPERIADRIGNEMKRGVTFINGKGWYTKTDNTILMVVARKHEARDIFKIVKQEDPDAFISMGTVMGVYGKGFDNIR